MERRIFLTASLFAILDTLAFTADFQNPSLAAKLAFSYLYAASVFVRVSKFWRANLDDHYSVNQVELIDGKLTAYVWLNALAREFHARVGLRLTLPLARFSFGIGACCPARSIVNFHRLSTLCNGAKACQKRALVGSEPESDAL